VRPEQSDRRLATLTGTNRNAVGEIRRELEATGLVSAADTRTDASGHAQPSHKAPPHPSPAGTDDAIIRISRCRRCAGITATCGNRCKATIGYR
jgi:hypothetical protein